MELVALISAQTGNCQVCNWRTMLYFWRMTQVSCSYFSTVLTAGCLCPECSLHFRIAKCFCQKCTSFSEDKCCVESVSPAHLGSRISARDHMPVEMSSCVQKALMEFNHCRNHFHRCEIRSSIRAGVCTVAMRQLAKISSRGTQLVILEESRWYGILGFKIFTLPRSSSTHFSSFSLLILVVLFLYLEWTMPWGTSHELDHFGTKLMVVKTEAAARSRVGRPNLSQATVNTVS